MADVDIEGSRPSESAGREQVVLSTAHSFIVTSA
jgi:hypothetical protein